MSTGLHLAPFDRVDVVHLGNRAGEFIHAVRVRGINEDIEIVAERNAEGEKAGAVYAGLMIEWRQRDETVAKSINKVILKRRP